MAELRRRAAADAANDSSTPPSSDKITASIRSEDKPKERIGVTDVLRILGGIALLNSALSYFITGDSFAWGYRPWWSNPTQLQGWMKGPVRLTDAQLAAYDGSDPSKPIYLALNGSIYDVSVGRNYYGPGGMYGFLSGKDASRAFITGCFQEDLVPDMRGVEEMYIPVDEVEDDAKLSSGEIKTRRERDMRVAKQKVKEGLEGWEKLFNGVTGKNYFKVGEVVREKGWLEKLPRRELCETAKQKRRPRKGPRAADP